MHRQSPRFGTRWQSPTSLLLCAFLTLHCSDNGAKPPMEPADASDSGELDRADGLDARNGACGDVDAGGPFPDDAACGGSIEVSASSAVACAFPIPVPPPHTPSDPHKLNIRTRIGPFCDRIDVYTVPGATSCGANGGWFFDDAKMPTKVILCPADCDPLGAPGSVIVFVFGCLGIPPPPP